ncbi:MAG: DUF711 family protein [Acidobacteriaceae bacterium]|nr:DUF711 family protein [Acidobacteriaceae bacterium]
MPGRRICLIGCVAFAAAGFLRPNAASPAGANPKVRAITAFIRIAPEERAHLEDKIGEALRVVRRVKALFAAEGYETQSVRVVTQPVAELVAGLKDDEAMAILKRIDTLSRREDFDPNVGPGMLKDSDDDRGMQLAERALSTLQNVEASAIIADENGIHWKTIHRTAQLVKYVSEHSEHSQGTFKFAATALLKPLGPFYPGAYHTGPGKQFSIGFEGANVVRDVFARDRWQVEKATRDLTEELTKHARVADRVGSKVAEETGWEYAGLDPTPAPLGDVSIGAAIEAFTGKKFGESGTMTAARVITTAVKAVAVKQIGYAGLMVPVMEDKLLAQRWAEGSYGVDSLLAYSAVCGTGLDTIPLPGDVSTEALERMYADVASLALKWNKPLAARLQPVKGKKSGDKTEYTDPFLFNTTVRGQN